MGKIKGREKVLIIQFSPLGDILLTLPVAEYLKTHWPGLQIDFLMYGAYRPLVENNPHIDKVLTLSGSSKGGLKRKVSYIPERFFTAIRMREEKYDIVLDYIGHSSSALLSYFSAASVTAGYGSLRLRGRLYNTKAYHPPVKRYSVDKKYDLLEPVLGKVENPLTQTRMYLTEEETQAAKKYFDEKNLTGKFTVLFSPDSPRVKKKWAEESYIKLGRLLSERYGAKILLLYGPGEEECSQIIQKGIGESAILLPPTSVREAAALLKEVSLTVLNDGGVKHIAVAVETPSVSIFGGTDLTSWHPPKLEWARAIQGEYEEGDNSFKISPERVMEEIETMISAGYISVLKKP